MLVLEMLEKIIIMKTKKVVAPLGLNAICILMSTYVVQGSGYVHKGSH